MAQRNKVGHYDIVAELGRGGMGVVYKGFEASLHRHVAIKMLSEALADDTMVVERFFREARSMAQLNDPHIVQIYLVGEDQGQPFFAMEFVEGESLSQRLKREQLLEPFEAARVLLQVAQGLAAAHDRGVVHRDIKPANLLITQRGVVKVADFGIALASQDFNKKLTGTGQFVGTPGYLSPEVCLGKPVDQRSDIFALGIVFFEMLTGQTPFKDESPLGMMLEVVQAEIPDVRRINESVDPRFAEILRRMVAKEPADRYADCHRLIADLVAAGVNAASPVTPARPVVASALLGTAVNVPTPPEMKRLATPAPQPVAAPAYSTVPSGASPVPPVAPVAPAPVAAPARPVAVVTRKSSALPWAVAVASLLVAGGGAAWYLSGKADPSSPQPPAAISAPVAATSTPSAPAATPPVAATAAPAATPPTPPSTATTVAATPTAPAVVAANPPADASADRGTPATAEVAVATPTEVATTAPPPSPAATPTAEVAAAAPSLPAESAPARVETAATTDAGGRAPYASAPTSTPNPQSAAIGARLADLREQRRDRLQARADVAAGRGQQLAKAETAPSPSEPAYRGPPRVIVLAFGDPAIAGSAELAIEERLGETGLDVVDEDLVPGLSGVENGTADMARLVAAVSRHAEFVVSVRVVPMGQQELTFYGESMTQYTARLDVGAYDVHNRRKVGAGWNAQVSFTHLNADPNTRAAIAPFLARIAQGLGARGRG